MALSRQHVGTVPPRRPRRPNYLVHRMPTTPTLGTGGTTLGQVAGTSAVRWLRRQTRLGRSFAKRPFRSSAVPTRARARARVLYVAEGI